MDITGIFISNGGNFLIHELTFREKVKKIKAVVFDWDGVFNDGSKSSVLQSGFSEGDSMGVNLLRFALNTQNESFPPAAIITGEKNDSAVAFAQREKFNALYYRIKFKKNALDHFCAHHNIAPDEVAWFFDDILDLSISQHAGLRFYLGKPYQPLTTEYIIKHELADYIPATKSGPGGIRECCELVWGMMGLHEEVIKNRIEFSETYTSFLTKKTGATQAVYTCTDDQRIIKA